MCNFECVSLSFTLIWDVLRFLSRGYCLRPIINLKYYVFFFQVAASEGLPASMFIPVPGPEKDTQTAPQSMVNSNSDDIKNLTG